jgi:hypothetical protein
MTDTEGYYKNKWTVKYTPPTPPSSSAAATRRVMDEQEAEAARIADADIIEIDEETGVLSVSTEISAKNKMKSTIPKTNGKCLIRLEE